jgi:hypothetical protein
MQNNKHFIRPNKRRHNAGQWWLMSVILVTWESEIRRTAVGSHSGQTVHGTLSQKHSTQKRAIKVAQW